MDNISHSLVGVALAELVYNRLPPTETSSRIRRCGLWFSSVLANNFPDFDFIWAKSLGPQDLGYLLQHRGHTHTLLMAFPQALLVLGLLFGLFRWRNWKLTRMEWTAVTGLAVLGPVVHIFLDWLNSYGVHPFWPFKNSWYYGDTLFIVEPLVWITFLVPLVWAFHRRILLAMIWFAIAGSLGILWTVSLVPSIVALMATVFTLVWWGILRKVPPARRIEMGLCAFFLWLGLFGGISTLIRREVYATYASADPGVRLHDVVLSPLPANPFCWRLWTVEALDTRQSYQVKRGIVAPVPGLLNASQCLAALPGERTGSTTPGADSRALWFQEDEFAMGTWRQVLKRQCPARAFLVYSRVPALEVKGAQVILSDLRFDLRRGGRRFTDLTLTGETADCEFPIPGWDAPRKALFGQED